MNRREGKTGRQGSQSGVTLIPVIFIIVILAFIGVMFVSLIGTGSFTSINDLQSARALYIAEGGAEYILQNRGFPNYSTGGAATPLGAGTFTIATPTYLTAALTNVATTVTVNSTTGFPGAGRIVIDAEQINYTGTTATTFTGCTRAQGGTVAAAHALGNAVYPATTVTVNVTVGATTITVGSTTGFLVPGVIRIDDEFIYCTGSTATTFTGCMRGYKSTVAAAHTAGVTRTVFQYTITATGTVGNARRTIKAVVWGPIEFDAASAATTGNNVASINWNHTVSGMDRILIVGVSIRSSAGQTVTGITYGAQSFPSPPNPIVQVTNANNVRVEQWYLLNPAIGTARVTVTLSAAARIVGSSVSLTGVEQVNPIDAFNSATGSSTTPSVTVTTNSNGAWVVDTLAHRLSAAGAPTRTVGANQTLRWSNTVANAANGVGGSGSTEGPQIPAGAVPMSWTLSNSQPWAICAVALKPSPFTVQWQEVFQ